MKEVQKGEKEIRNRPCEFRVPEGDSRTVEGYALLFNVESDGLNFIEIIQEGAVDEEVIKRSDVLALLNHDERRGILARARGGEGTLTLEVDEKGLRYSFEAPDTPIGNELLSNLRRGEIDESSFAFTVAEEEWQELAGGRWVRTIRKFNQLFDVSPVYNAAYSQTSVYLRGKQEKEEELRKAAADDGGRDEPITPKEGPFVPEGKNYRTIPFTF